MLFVLSKNSKWILDEFGDRFGFSPVYRLLVYVVFFFFFFFFIQLYLKDDTNLKTCSMLSWAISVLSVDIDKLIMVHLLLRRILNLFQDDDYIYNKREVRC